MSPLGHVAKVEMMQAEEEWDARGEERKEPRMTLGSCAVGASHPEFHYRCHGFRWRSRFGNAGGKSPLGLRFENAAFEMTEGQPSEEAKGRLELRRLGVWRLSA